MEKFIYKVEQESTLQLHSDNNSCILLHCALAAVLVLALCEAFMIFLCGLAEHRSGFASQET